MINTFKKIAIFASGTGSNFQAINEHWLKDKNPNFEISLLICDQPNALVIEKAKNFSVISYVLTLQEFKNKKAYEEKIKEILLSHNIDFIVLAGYMKLINETLLKCFPNKILNIHPSLLPLYKGKSAIEECYHNNLKSQQYETGISIHVVDETLDGGEIIFQDKILIKNPTQLSELKNKIHELEHKNYYQQIKTYIQNFK